MDTHVMWSVPLEVFLKHKLVKSQCDLIFHPLASLNSMVDG